MERAMQRLWLRDHIRNEEVREKTGLQDVLAAYKESKFRCAEDTLHGSPMVGGPA